MILFNNEEKKLLNLKEASIWASQYINHKVTISNISYLIQYGRVKKYGSDGKPLKRPVLNRAEKDRDTPYAETILHLKER